MEPEAEVKTKIAEPPRSSGEIKLVEKFDRLVSPLEQIVGILERQEKSPASAGLTKAVRRQVIFYLIIVLLMAGSMVPFTLILIQILDQVNHLQGQVDSFHR